MESKIAMHIIEQHCQGKRSDQSLNEDGLIITDGFAAVVDGVTSKSVHHPAGLVLGRVQHRGDVSGPFSRTERPASMSLLPTHTISTSGRSLISPIIR
ncbi:hypothetical protein [Bifidobacterium breve]|uniref:hypothetical protein n=1 Tax=Bifidobacterium breve TaxID=1685 RepID=UPI00046D64AB|nr:hypothetical protein [Bifidobacterium breve]WPS63532.1 hypothetical protein B12L_02300 [Bifidobacterium breve 12L]MCZ4418837.1 hypothetical protein [Bifidobacterium breve]MCZ4422608.1 hypothetical protein [Bifidobacterium breve]MCZ4465512.1 hypothetical protein [Bifidobacterium breve]MCZ4468259.1 hypothetical protein [Bifidobacterium breve]